MRTTMTKRKWLETPSSFLYFRLILAGKRGNLDFHTRALRKSSTWIFIAVNVRLQFPASATVASVRNKYYCKNMALIL